MAGFGSVTQNKNPVALSKITDYRTLFIEDNTIHHHIAWATMWSVSLPLRIHSSLDPIKSKLIFTINKSLIDFPNV